MDESIKKILLKQVELLQQKSENARTEELIVLSTAMAALVYALAGGSQFPGGAGLNCQYVAPLPLEDLLALHAARVQRWNRQDPVGKDRTC